jgi:hypothetical protein
VLGIESHEPVPLGFDDEGQDASRWKVVAGDLRVTVDAQRENLLQRDAQLVLCHSAGDSSPDRSDRGIEVRVVRVSYDQRSSNAAFRVSSAAKTTAEASGHRAVSVCARVADARPQTTRTSALRSLGMGRSSPSSLCQVIVLLGESVEPWVGLEKGLPKNDKLIIVYR